jgi:hypothetical protein
MEKETFASIVGKVENVVTPFGFKILKADKRYITRTGHNSCISDQIRIDSSRVELIVTIIHVKEISSIQETPVVVVGETEKAMVPLGFEISNIDKQLISSDNCSSPYSEQSIDKVVLLVTFSRVGELG